MSNFKNQHSDTIRQITKHQPAILAYILTLHPDRSEAQDILQETNVVLWQKLEDYQDGTSFKAWAFRIAYLQTLAHFKRKKRKSWLGFSSELVETLATEAEPILSDLEHRQQALQNCLQKLADRDREIVRSHYESSLPLADISRKLNRSVGALKQVLFRVRKSLRTCVEQSLRKGVTDA
ncbi:MAG: sigma-70 family RNA polymerase sigma factor [Planctomycetota bacterium]